MSDINLNLLGIKRINCNSQSGKEEKTKVTVYDVLERLKNFDDKTLNQGVLSSKSVYIGKNSAHFPLTNDAKLLSYGKTNYIETKSGNILVVRRLDGRKAKVNKKFVESLKKNPKRSVVYVEISRKGVKVIDGGSNNDIDELIEMFNKNVNIGTDGLESADSGEDSEDLSEDNSENKQENPFDSLITEEVVGEDRFDVYEPLEPNSEGYLDVNGKRCKL
jgi:hypothetical protein